MELFDNLSPDTTILTPNRRLAATLLKLFNAKQITAGKLAWPTLDALPISSWMQRLWENFTAQQVSAAPLLLSVNQEQLLWEDILRLSPHGKNLLQLSSTAELARQAWNTLKQWKIGLYHAGLLTTDDGVIFQEWAREFQALCEKNVWLDNCSLADVVAEKMAAREIIPPAQIVLMGFTEISPQYQALLSACETGGSQIVYHQSETRNNQVARVSLMDQKTEIRTMAKWAKAIWEKNPAATVGCIFPQLENLRDEVIQTFSAVFAEKNTFSLNHLQYPFNISAGKKLAQYPVIYKALQLLHFNINNTSLDTLSSVLLSPFIGEAESEQIVRAKFDNALRQANVNTLSLKKILFARPTKKSLDFKQECPLFAARLRQFVEQRRESKTPLPASAWVGVFMQLLTSLGWPGERSLSSYEYQVVERWLKLLTDYASLDAILGSMSYQQALHYLTYLANIDVFQPESPETPIQILGMLEAAERPFDYLWVMGLDDTTWPPAPKPNPFIPQRLQKNLQMPHATAERELVYCQKLTEQLQRGAKEVIFSHAEKNDDAELRVSPIISNLPEISLAQIPLADSIAPADRIYSARQIEFLQDELAPAVLPTERVRGGTRIFQLQAACPFRAFGELRLHIKKIDPPTPGLDPKDRGTIVHKALEIIWQRLVSLENLLQYANLESLIVDCVEQALSLSTSEALTNVRYRQLEAKRLESLLLEWLEQEKTRRDFKVVAVEQEQTVSIGSISVKVRVDRIDQLDNGKNIIIDYKTGKDNSIQKWFGDRPEEPQLPLYCVLDPDNTVGILFGQFNPENMGFVGVSEVDLGIKSAKRLLEIVGIDWKEQVAHWQATLERLGADFLAGKAAVDPKIPGGTCEYCHLQLLCRVDL
jgi:ATP-dependent helicase/nuclease subunit B